MKSKLFNKRAGTESDLNSNAAQGNSCSLVQENPPKTEHDKRNNIATILIFVISVISAGIGLLILFVPEINAATLCYIFCGVLVIIGIILIAKFFAVKAFKKFHDYSFALGVLLVVLGCIGFIRNENLSASLDMWTGFIVLCIGIFMLQCAIQLKLLGSTMWLVDIILTVLIMSAAILTLIYWELLFDALPEFPYWSILIAGIINVINFPVVLVTLKSFGKNKPAAEQAQASQGSAEIPSDNSAAYSGSAAADSAVYSAAAGSESALSSTETAYVSTEEDDLDNTAPLPDLSGML